LGKVGSGIAIAVEKANNAVADTPQVMGEDLQACWVLRGGRWMGVEVVANLLLLVLSLQEREHWVQMRQRKSLLSKFESQVTVILRKRRRPDW
jgi:hypothetical protein